jgi:hypothetical protein
MSLNEISRRLRQTADSIDSNAETLNRLKFLKLADTFLKTLQKFDSAIAEHSAGPSPEVHELEINLKSLFGPTQDTKRIGQIAKSVFGAAFNPKKTENFSAYIARVSEQAVALGKSQPLREALQAVYSQRAESESIKTEEDLIMKVVSLANLTPADLEREQLHLIENKALFGKLMKIAHRLDRNIQQGA